MFIELHDYKTGDPWLANISMIVFVDSTENGNAVIITQEETWEVKESYEQVKSLLDVSSIG